MSIAGDVRSRRALLTAGLGALAATAVRGMARPDAARAHDPQDVLLGGDNSATTTTAITNSANGSAVVSATTITGTALYGITDSGTAAVYGDSNSATAVVGNSYTGTGVYGTNTLIDRVSVPRQNEGVARIRLAALQLLPGAYDVDIGIIDPQSRYYDYHEKGLSFRVIGEGGEIGIARLDHAWEFE